ncbi:hypothetical protein M433DRAFT_156146 [Acidomyces richmondensis BFW]|nr:MAG: hypothetical protein FE78DRAFT_92780 [Acidomyces sp. 'richmondensis']KYG43947.1 hypothetical protein M433DRAFT_156146 [Acidomyces richmondensis BFW]
MTDQSASHLFSLPAELRNVIWTFLLKYESDNDEVRYSRLSLTAGSSAAEERPCVNVLRTCKQANSEGTPILYGENRFHAHPSLLTALPSFLLLTRPNRITLSPVTSPRLVQLIRRYYLHVRLDTDPHFSRCQVEESFSGVEELEIEVFQAMYGSCDFSVLRLFEGVRGVGKAVVQGSVGDGKYAEWLANTMMSAPGTETKSFTQDCKTSDMAFDVWQHGNR